MTEGIEGIGEIRRDGELLCRVHYQLQRPPASAAGAAGASDPENRFTLTDGLIEIEGELPDDQTFELEPGQELTLTLEKPLRDGRKTLTLIVEPYTGHRPDERYQVSIRE